MAENATDVLDRLELDSIWPFLTVKKARCENYKQA